MVCCRCHVDSVCVVWSIKWVVCGLLQVSCGQCVCGLIWSVEWVVCGLLQVSCGQCVCGLICRVSCVWSAAGVTWTVCVWSDLLSELCVVCCRCHVDSVCVVWSVEWVMCGLLQVSHGQCVCGLSYWVSCVWSAAGVTCAHGKQVVDSLVSWLSVSIIPCSTSYYLESSFLLLDWTMTYVIVLHICLLLYYDMNILEFRVCNRV